MVLVTMALKKKGSYTQVVEVGEIFYSNTICMQYGSATTDNAQHDIGYTCVEVVRLQTIPEILLHHFQTQWTPQKLCNMS